jgi:N-methylhydantoinase B
MTVLDPIELEVLRNALTAAAAEMDVTMWRTSRSTIVREMLDYSTAIFDANGNNVAQSTRIPQHLNSMGYFLQTIRSVHSGRPLGRGRCHHLERSLLRRPAFA